MSILPVIDLKDGAVVRGVAGQRNEYRPIQSVVAKGSSPREVARSFAGTFGFESVYVADLDAIEGKPPCWEALREISQSGLRIWIDSGLSDSNQVTALLEHSQGVQLEGIIVGLESIADAVALAAVFDAIGTSDQAVFSLDLKHGQPFTDSPAWQAFTPLEIVALAVEIGFTRIVVLDLASVGSEQGPSVESLCREIRSAYPNGQLTSGGGVRDISDVHRFLDAGCNHVLVASALHHGQIDVASTRNL